MVTGQNQFETTNVKRNEQKLMNEMNAQYHQYIFLIKRRNHFNQIQNVFSMHHTFIKSNS